MNRMWISGDVLIGKMLWEWRRGRGVSFILPFLPTAPILYVSNFEPFLTIFPRIAVYCVFIRHLFTENLFRRETKKKAKMALFREGCMHSKWPSIRQKRRREGVIWETQHSAEMHRNCYESQWMYASWGRTSKITRRMCACLFEGPWRCLKQENFWNCWSFDN